MTQRIRSAITLLIGLSLIAGGCAFIYFDVSMFLGIIVILAGFAAIFLGWWQYIYWWMGQQQIQSADPITARITIFSDEAHCWAQVRYDDVAWSMFLEASDQVRELTGYNDDGDVWLNGHKQPVAIMVQGVKLPIIPFPSKMKDDD